MINGCAFDTILNRFISAIINLLEKKEPSMTNERYETSKTMTKLEITAASSSPSVFVIKLSACVFTVYGIKIEKQDCQFIEFDIKIT